MKLRPVAPEDIAGIVELEKICFTDPWSEDSFRAALGDALCVFIAAEEAGILAGYVLAASVMDDADIMSVAVAPDFRRRGFGRALLDEALCVLRKRGVGTVFLEVRESNVAARSLYSARGFEPIDVRKKYYRRPVEDAVVMRLDLAAPRG